MGYIALGVIAFAIAGFFDLAALRGWRYLKQAISLAALLLWGVAFYGLLRTSSRFWLPALLIWLGWPLLLVSLFLLVYSLFLEIPFWQTYAADGVGDRLVKTGTYALVRHPGVLWLALFLASLILVSGSRLLLIAAPVWLLMDVLYVWIQERFYFDKMFPGYEQYERETPMLIPTAESIAKCIRTFGVGVKGGKGGRTRIF